MPDRVDAPIDRDELACPDPELDRPDPQAELQQLLAGHIPMLLPGERGNRGVKNPRHDEPGVKGRI
jgi:hypothetical protein